MEHLEGLYITTEPDWAEEQRITKLFIGKSKKKGLLSLNGSLADKLQQACLCEGVVVSEQEASSLRSKP